jgi:hypothetical protein
MMGWHRRPVVTARLVLACLLLAPALAGAQTTREIFHIQRSAGPSIVRYDARLGKDGQLDPKTPVVAYRLHPDGRVEQLDGMERRFFYGFKVRLDDSGKFWHLTLVTARERPMKLHLVNGRPRAEGRIAGVWAHVHQLYVKYKEKSLIPGVVWVDLIGADVKTGAPVRERVVTR